MIDLMEMMKQAQELQERMQQMQADLDALEIEGQSGAGLVRVTLNGKGEMRGVRVDQAWMKPTRQRCWRTSRSPVSRTPRSRSTQPYRPRCRRSPAAYLPPGLKLF